MRYSRFLFLIGFALFGFLLWFLGPEKVSGIFATLSKADLLIFAAAIFLILPAVIIKGIKQSVLLNQHRSGLRDISSGQSAREGAATF